MTRSADEVVSAFVREWDVPAPDVARLAPYFTEDAVYHNIPMDPIVGKEAVLKALEGMGKNMQSAGWEVRHQVASGDVVMNERIDRFSMGGRTIAIPVVGVFEVRDGQIAAWRDYFDLKQFRAQLA